MPGVSMRMTCAAGRFPFFGRLRMPWMRLRVVCGLRVTMASLAPTSALSSVDLPALGRPRMVTKPERRDMEFGRSEDSVAISESQWVLGTWYLARHPASAAATPSAGQMLKADG